MRKIEIRKPSVRNDGKGAGAVDLKGIDRLCIVPDGGDELAALVNVDEDHEEDENDPPPSKEDFSDIEVDIRSHPIPTPTTLLVDAREPKAIVRMLRTVSNLDVKVKRLSVGDYVVEGFLAIERKTPLDFVESVIGDERRLFHQTSDLLASGLKPIVLLEGDVYEQCSMTVKSVDGMLSYLVMRGIHLIYTRSIRHSAAMIAKIVRHTVYGLGYPDPVTCAVAPRNPRQAAAYLLSCIPGVSGTLAKRLIDQFGSVNGVCRATRQELLSIHGIGATKADQIITCLGIRSSDLAGGPDPSHFGNLGGYLNHRRSARS